MKTIPALTLSIAALAALVITAPISFEVAVSVLFAAGLVGILIADYSHGFGPARSQLSAAVAAARRSERLRLAA